MSATGKRGPDYLNTIGVITVGICGAVLTYVSIVLLTAYYMNDTTQREQQNAIEAPASLRNTVQSDGLVNLDGTKEGTISIDRAIDAVVADAQKDPSNLVPAVGPLTKPTVVAQYGRPKDLPSAPPPAPAPVPEPAPAPTEPAPTAPTAPATTPGTGTGTGAPATPAPAGGNAP